MRIQSALFVVLVGFAAASGLAGCFFNYVDDCDLNPNLECFWQGTGGSGGTGGTGGASPGCTPNQTGDAIADGCGFFVSALNGDDANDGKLRDKAVATIGRALEVAKGKPIYVCADEAKAYEEAIELDGDATLFGGLDCVTWKYAAGTKTKWTAGADELPLRLVDGASVAIADMAIEAADATKQGGSSIAILAQAGASVDLVRCEVTAGNGKDGETPAVPAGSGTAGLPGEPGLDGCIDTGGKLGGDGGQLICDGTSVSGGSGGQGTKVDAGGPGGDGFPADDMGKGGKPQSFDGVMTTTACTPGGDGAEGLVGDPGTNATGSGSLSSTGYTGESGADGASLGQPGHGGGGGGGAKKCANMTFAGPSAGGGGSGGCGGAKGKGGQPGGASIAVVSLSATLVLSDVKLTAKKGGKGGDGGLGQPGGDGGKGGTPGAGDASAAACAGGKGGKGGPGGRGGGGLGGPSIGIAFTGDAPDVKGASITTAQPGDGGAGETGTADSGEAAKTKGF